MKYVLSIRPQLRPRRTTSHHKACKRPATIISINASGRDCVCALPAEQIRFTASTSFLVSKWQARYGKWFLQRVASVCTTTGTRRGNKLIYWSIRYRSISIKDAQHAYDTKHCEEHAVMWAVLLIIPYSEDIRVAIRSVHCYLKWIPNFSDAFGMLARWRLRSYACIAFTSISFIDSL